MLAAVTMVLSLIVTPLVSLVTPAPAAGAWRGPSRTERRGAAGDGAGRSELGPAPAAGGAVVALEEPGPGALADRPALAGDDLQPDTGI